MKNLSKLVVVILATTITFSASATPIKIVPLTGGAHPATLGDNDEYVMTQFVAPLGGLHSCTASPSPLGGQVCFVDADTNDLNGLPGESISLFADDPDWWQYDDDPLNTGPDHGNIFVVDAGRHVVDLILPANTRAFSLFVGSSAPGSAWIQAFDDSQEFAHRRGLLRRRQEQHARLRCLYDRLLTITAHHGRAFSMGIRLLFIKPG